MTSIVSSKGQTVVPKKLRRQYNIKPGSILDWEDQGNGIRVVKLERPKQSSFMAALRRLGSVPAARRKKEAVRYSS